MSNNMTHELAHQLWVYEDGILYWRKRVNARAGKGDPAGCIRNGYLSVSYGGKRYRATHIIWLMHTGDLPEKFIDHIDGDPSNNRIDNLREATHQQNMQNCKCSNPIGYKGVKFFKGQLQRPWNARMRDKSLGMYASAEEAAKAYDRAAIEAYGEFARLNFSDGDTSNVE